MRSPRLGKGRKKLPSFPQDAGKKKPPPQRAAVECRTYRSRSQSGRDLFLMPEMMPMAQKSITMEEPP